MLTDRVAWGWILKFIILCWPLQAHSTPILVVNSLQGDHPTLDYMQWQFTSHADTDWQTIQESTAWKPLKNTRLGFQFTPIFTRLAIVNLSSEPQRFILYNPYAGMDKIDVLLIFQTQGAINKTAYYELGLHRSVKDQPIPHQFSTLLLILEPDQQVTLYTRLETLGAYQVDWRITDPKTFSKQSQSKTLLWGIFGGLILFFVIYNFLVMRQIHQQALWPYITFALLSLYYQYATKGILRFDPTGLSIYLVSLMTWVTPFLILASLTYFSILFFNTKHHLPRLHKLLQLAILIYLIAFFAHLSGLVQLMGHMIPGLTIAYIGFTLPVVVGIIALRYKLIGAGLYLSGQTALMAGHLIQIMVLEGLLPNNQFTSFAIPIGVLLDLFFLSLAFAHRIAKLKQEHERQRQLMIAQSRFSSISHAFGSISYEWRVPLVQLGSQLTELETRLVQHPGKNNQATINRLIDKMQVSLQGLNDTVYKFLNLYTTDKKASSFDVRKRLDEVFSLIKGKQAWSMTTFDIYAPQPIQILSYPNTFSQVLMLLLDIATNIQQTPQSVQIQLELINQQMMLSIKNIAWEMTDPAQTSLNAITLNTAQVLVEDKLDGHMSYYITNQMLQIDLLLPLSVQSGRNQ